MYLFVHKYAFYLGQKHQEILLKKIEPFLTPAQLGHIFVLRFLIFTICGSLFQAFS